MLREPHTRHGVRDEILPLIDPGSLELRAALSLSRLWSRSRRDEARRLLGGVLETFSEGHDTADLRAASEQMARLARTG